MVLTATNQRTRLFELTFDAVESITLESFVASTAEACSRLWICCALGILDTRDITLGVTRPTSVNLTGAAAVVVVALEGMRTTTCPSVADLVSRASLGLVTAGERRRTSDQGQFLLPSLNVSLYSGCLLHKGGMTD
jgi:hypothetical protein